MVYTITFNPSIDYVMNTGNLNLGHTNRSISESMSVGGKGINVSLVLAQFGVSSTALGFVGGFTGLQLEKMLADESVQTDFVHLAGGNTRINVKLISDEMTEVNAGGPEVSDDDVQKLLKKTDMIVYGDIVVVAGSVPKNLSDDIYEKILQRLSDRSVKTVVDATGALLIKTLKYRPFLIKPNIDELCDIFNTKISSESDIVEYAIKLQNMGARNVLVSMGKDGAILVADDGTIITQRAAPISAVNPVGAGDSMVAGFIAGSEIDYHTALVYGTAAGGATASLNGLANKQTIDRLLSLISADS